MPSTVDNHSFSYVYKNNTYEKFKYNDITSYKCNEFIKFSLR